MQEWIYEFYISLMQSEAHWKLNEIDEMDIWFYLDILNYQDEKEYVEQVEALDAAGL